MSAIATVQVPCIAQEEPLETRFRRLRDEWDHETLTLSDPDAIAMHPAYQQIIGMGPAALPFILRDLAAEPRFWFWALTAITGEDPIPRDAAGRVREMASAWLAWGRSHGFDTEPHT